MTTYIGHATIEPLGAVTLYSDGKALIGLSLPTQKYDVPVTEEVIEKTNLPIFKSTITWLQRYCQGKNPGSSLSSALLAQISAFAYGRHYWIFLMASW